MTITATELPTLADLTPEQWDQVLGTDVEADEHLIGRLEYVDSCEALVHDDDTDRILIFDPSAVRLTEVLA